MVTSVRLYLGLLALVALERGVELVLSARNARLALARGAVETGQGHYPVMSVFHGAFLPRARSRWCSSSGPFRERWGGSRSRWYSLPRPCATGPSRRWAG